MKLKHNHTFQESAAYSPIAPPTELLPSGSKDSEERVCDYATYMKLLQDNAQLQRANRLLQSRVTDKVDSGHESLLQTELKVSEAKIKDLEALVGGQQNVDLTLVEEKRQLQQLNLGLSERIAELQENESHVLVRLKDARDQAELLEFRVLELEEENEKVGREVFFLRFRLCV